MYNFSGLIYRIWTVVGLLLLLGLTDILFEKPWSKSFKIRKCKYGIFAISVAVCMGLVYGSRIVSPDVGSYTGEFVESHRTSKVSPFTMQYTFWNGQGKKLGLFLDLFSKKKVFPCELICGDEYVVVYDKLTNIILKVDAKE